MPIPPRFQMSPPSEGVIRRMCELCNEIEQTILENGDPSKLLKEWNQHATRECDLGEFTSYWKAINQEDFVKEVLLPRPKFVKDLTFEEALAVLKAVSTAELPEGESIYYLHWLNTQFPDSNMSDLIYWPDEWFEDASLFRHPDGTFKPKAELSPEQILGYAMKWSSRELLGTPTDIDLPYPLPEDQ